MTMLAAVTADAGLGIWGAYGGSNIDLVEDSTYVRTGDRAFKTTGGAKYGSIPIGSLSEIYIRVALYFTGIDNTFGHAPVAGALLSWLDSDGSYQGTLLITHNEYKLEYRRGDYDSTLVESSTETFPPNEWHVFEVHIQIDNSTGRLEVRQLGSTVLEFDGDTQATEVGNIDTVHVGYGGRSTRVFQNGWFDDIIVNDTTGTENPTWPGLGGLYYLKPNAAGDQTDLTPDSGDNHERVDEIEPDDDDSYVESDVVDELDLYELENLPADGTINAAIWHARAKLSESGEGEIARMLKIAGTEYQGDDEALGVDYADVAEILELNPDDSAAWEKADLDAIQAGVKVR